MSKRFARESALRDQLVEQLAKESKGLVGVRSEMPVGSMIPDIVIVRRRGVASGVSRPLTMKQAHVLAMLRYQSRFRLRTLASRCQMRITAVSACVRELAALGFAEVLDTGAVRLAPEMRTSDFEVIAIEAKLERWKEALAQAAGYRAFADRVIVALAARPDILERLSGEFASNGVGLWGIRPDRPRVEVVTPKYKERRSALREYVVGAALAGHKPWRRA